jgi:hypothetical protein
MLNHLSQNQNKPRTRRGLKGHSCVSYSLTCHTDYCSVAITGLSWGCLQEQDSQKPVQECR